LIQGTNPNLFFFLFCHSVLYSQSIWESSCFRFKYGKKDEAFL
jgi:hypothetical protein